MKCDQHPHADAIGRCVSCGRGVCSDCKINFNNKSHCKACVEAGRVVGGGSAHGGAGGYSSGPQAQYSQYPTTPYPGFAYPYPAYRPPGSPAPEIYIDQWPAQSRPEPTGKPDEKYFKVGSIGCVIGAIASGLMSVSFVLWTLNAQVVSIISVIMFLAMLPYIYGMFGFYRNYGSNAALGGSITLAICLLSFALISVYSSLLPVESDYYYYYGESTPWHTGSYIFAGVGHIIGAMALQQARSYIYPIGQPGGTSQWSVFGMVIAGCIFLTTAGLYMTPLCFWSIISLIGWILLALSLFTASSIFTQAPIPKIPTEEPPLPDAAITPSEPQYR